MCYHGSPRSYHEGIASTTPDEDLDQMLCGCPAAMFAGGHTHTQMVRRVGEATVLNPGSVGAPPSQTGQVRQGAWAEYGILNWEDSTVGIELHRVSVDVRLVMETAHRSGMPHADWWGETRYGAMASHLAQPDLSSD